MQKVRVSETPRNVLKVAFRRLKYYLGDKVERTIQIKLGKPFAAINMENTTVV